MKTSLKTGVAQIFSCCLQKLGARKFGAALPLYPAGRYSPFNETKRISSSSRNYVVLTF